MHAAGRGLGIFLIVMPFVVAAARGGTSSPPGTRRARVDACLGRAPRWSLVVVALVGVAVLAVVDL